MSTETAGPKHGFFVRHWLLSLILFVLIGGTATILTLNVLFKIGYSGGNRVGVIQKFSSDGKGNIWKTYEGELSLSVAPSLSGNVAAGSQVGGIWQFTVLDKNVVKDVDDAQLFRGEVRLHYKQRHFHLPWYGETPYIVDEVEKLR